MSSNENMDQLAQDATDALAKGMTYGKYMAWKQSRRRMPERPVKRVLQEGEAHCKHCGKIFTKDKHRKVYCSRQCRADSYGVRSEV